jgi:ariadne-1
VRYYEHNICEILDLVQEGHAPVDCNVFRKWRALCDKDEARLASWLQDNTKQCPKCQVKIESTGLFFHFSLMQERYEKTKGCKHMRCKCGYHFCWDCKVSLL